MRMSAIKHSRLNVQICAQFPDICCTEKAATFRAFFGINQRMFERLQQKWQVSPLRLALILITFGVGGSLTGLAARTLLGSWNPELRLLWILVYLLLVVLLWPLAVVVVSVPFGQFRFFQNYLARIVRSMGLAGPDGSARVAQPVAIAVFASGAGSNAQKIIDRFRDSPAIRVALIVCNKPGAGVLQIAQREGIPYLLIERERFFRGDGYMPELQQHGIRFIVLAGFLWKVPGRLIRAYPQRIVNIHPALLPAYGGKGMYGQHVHEAVLAAHEKESGITIHFVDEFYDHGQILFQAKCPVLETDSPATLAERIHALEHAHYPAVIEQLVTGKD